jgi:hypothetical protein
MNKAQKLINTIEDMGYLSPEDTNSFPGHSPSVMDADANGGPKNKSTLIVELEQLKHEISKIHDPHRKSVIQKRISDLEKELLTKYHFKLK